MRAKCVPNSCQRFARQLPLHDQPNHLLRQDRIHAWSKNLSARPRSLHRVRACSPEITDCIIKTNHYGIYAYNSSSPTITGCTVSDNQNLGLYVYSNSSAIISDRTINSNGTSGIYFRNYSDGTLTNCIIAKNTTYGVRTNDNSSPSIINCTLTLIGTVFGGHSTVIRS